MNGMDTRATSAIPSTTTRKNASPKTVPVLDPAMSAIDWARRRTSRCAWRFGS